MVSEGYAMAYAKDFGLGFDKTTSTLTNLLDVARGGKFLTVPKKYPAKAWYKY